jgi:predicted PurR-regulated permease PerM
MLNSKTFSNKTNNLLYIVLLVFVLYILKPLIVPLIFAVILSVAIFPFVLYLEKKLRFNRIISSLLAILLLFICLSIIITFIGYQISDIISKSDIYLNKLEEIYYQILHHIDVKFGIKKSELINKNISFAETFKENFANIIEFVGTSGSIIGDALLVPLYMFFFIYYRKFFQTFLFKIFSNGNDFKIKILINKLYQVQQDYLIGLSTVMFIVGILDSLSLLALGIENPFFYGFLAAVLLLIPYIGIFIGSLIPALIALITKDSYIYSVLVIGSFSFIQFLEGNFITPKITGSKLNINSLVAIVSILAFSMLWGTSGMIIALPIVASLKIIFDAIPALQPYGFLLSEPHEQQLSSFARIRLKKWKEIRKRNQNN